MLWSMTGVEEWKEFGLAGMVIFALFSLIALMFHFLVKYIDRITEAHRDERLEWGRAHDNAHKELVNQLDKNADRVCGQLERDNDRVRETVKELTETIRELTK